MNSRYNALGKFSIDIDVINLELENVLQIMARCVIVRAETLYLEAKISYTAISPELFRPLEAGETIPEYVFVFNGATLEKAIEVTPC